MKITYHASKDLQAEVHFMRLHDWRNEIELLLGDLFNEEGEFRPGSRSDESASAWAKASEQTHWCNLNADIIRR